MTANNETALQVVEGDYREIDRPIDIESQVGRINSLRKYVETVLDEKAGHYGRMPGVKRKFLQKPGAELLYRALECKDVLEVEEERLDWETEFCYYRVRCQVVHIPSGEVLGEARGSCSSLEYAAYCRVRKEQPWKEGDELLWDCPLHGLVQGRIFRDNRNGGQRIACSKRQPQGLDRTLHNVLAKAEKRAYVAAIRKVAAVSELFTQDEDIYIPDELDAEPGEKRAENRRPEPAQKAPQAAQKAAPAPKSSSTPDAAPAAKKDESPAIHDALEAIKGSGWAMTDIKAFLDDENIQVKSLRPGLIAWCNKKGKPPKDFVAALRERFAEPAAEAESAEAEQTQVTCSVTGCTQVVRKYDVDEKGEPIPYCEEHAPPPPEEDIAFE